MSSSSISIRLILEEYLPMERLQAYFSDYTREHFYPQDAYIEHIEYCNGEYDIVTSYGVVHVVEPTEERHKKLLKNRIMILQRRRTYLFLRMQPRTPTLDQVIEQMETACDALVMENLCLLG